MRIRLKPSMHALQTLRTLCERVSPVSAEAWLETVRARFEADLSLQFLPIESAEGDLLGLLDRATVLASGQALSTTVRQLARPAALASADTDLFEVAADLLGEGASAPPAALIVMEGEAYLGLIDVAGLLRGAVRADAERRRLLAAAYREIDASLGGLLALAGLMKRQPLSLDAAAQLRAIVGAAETAADLAGAVAVAEATGAVEAPARRLETVSARDLADRIDALWQARTRHRGVRLITACSGESELLLSLDAGRLRQVLEAVVLEAFEASPSGVVEVRLGTEREGAAAARLSVQVRDSRPHDPGAEPAQASFSQARRAALTAAMGGALRRERNHGAGVTVSFDVRAALARSAEEIARADEAASTRSLGHILVVDDNATNRLVAEALCQGFGFTAEAVEDGLQAVEAARLRAFDLILMDIKMPGMDGVAATRAIRALPGAGARTPIVALTANADREAVAGYLAAGMCGVVEKPIKPDALFSAIAAALDPGAVERVAAA